MRILQVPPLAESVPPRLYGGTERVVAWLTDELVSRGHRVGLLGTGDSRTRGELIPVWPRALRLARPQTDPALAQAAQLEALARHARAFDVIHCHGDWVHLPLLTRLGVPFVTTLHGRLDLPGLSDVAAQFPDAPFVSISESQRSPVPEARWVATIHHGFPPDILRPEFGPGEYLAFLGRISEDKGCHTAIRIASAADLPLRIAAKILRSERRYFKQAVEPGIDGKQIVLHGEVDDRAKQGFLASASALLFPIQWPEPFGLVMIEAMACGTPVIAFRQGSVPEVIEDGVSGFIVDEAAAIEAVKRVGDLDRREVRAAFERRFTAERMAEGYEEVYRRLMGRSLAQPLIVQSDGGTHSLPEKSGEKRIPVGVPHPGVAVVGTPRVEQSRRN